jgi:hypothetical protein
MSNTSIEFGKAGPLNRNFIQVISGNDSFRSLRSHDADVSIVSKTGFGSFKEVFRGSLGVFSGILNFPSCHFKLNIDGILVFEKESYCICCGDFVPSKYCC